MVKKVILIAAAIVMIIGSSVRSQDLGNKIGQVNGLYADKYLEPMSLGLGMTLNSGYIGSGTFLNTKSALPMNLSLTLGFNTSYLFLSDKDKSFSVSYSDSVLVNIAGTNHKVLANIDVNNAPTVFGGTTQSVADINYIYNGQQYSEQRKLIGGMTSLSVMPFVIPQIGIGSFYGIDITLRFLPRMSLGQYGEVMFAGFGVRYNLNSVLKKLPFDLSVQTGFQNFNILDTAGLKFFNGNSFFANAQVSKSFKRLAGYAAIQYEQFNTEITYSYTTMAGQNVGVLFDTKSTADVRGVIGASVNLNPVLINADLNFGKRMMATVGIAVGLK
ncbi:MAG TPA: hypothetical protein PK447_02985 [Ignavibacteria bacterium]|nr:hypothetical protein [Ignavibacteria bacterium]